MSDRLISVPYEHRDIMKSLGGRWKPDEKKWIAPDYSDLSRLIWWIDQSKPVAPFDASAAWQRLPARTTDPESLLKLLPTGRLSKRPRFFCGMCDSDSGGNEDWMFDGLLPLKPPNLCWCSHGTLYLLSHHEIGILRRAEYEILLNALNDGMIEPTG